MHTCIQYTWESKPGGVHSTRKADANTPGKHLGMSPLIPVLSPYTPAPVLLMPMQKQLLQGGTPASHTSPKGSLGPKASNKPFTLDRPNGKTQTNFLVNPIVRSSQFGLNSPSWPPTHGRPSQVGLSACPRDSTLQLHIFTQPVPPAWNAFPLASACRTPIDPSLPKWGMLPVSSRSQVLKSAYHE